MKHERKTLMGGVDKLYEMRMKRQNERKLKLERARLREETYIREHINRNTRGLEIIDEEGELEFSSEFGKRNRMNDSDYEPPKKKKEPEMITIQINPSEWIDSVALVADKTGTSTRTALLHAAALMKSGGDDISDLTLSVSSMRRHRVAVRESKSHGIMEAFKTKTKTACSRSRFLVCFS